MEELVDFGRAILALEQGKRVQRDGWNNDKLFVFKQVPATIGMKIVPNMQSLPQSAKNEFIKRAAEHVDKIVDSVNPFDAITYQNQVCLVAPDNTLYGWSPSIGDTLEED